ncbi:MAG: hypothetical protein JNK04_23530 [Myxococcales bacterium]|nr:hypothetical protein [Myxococcales bacterium]
MSSPKSARVAFSLSRLLAERLVATGWGKLARAASFTLAFVFVASVVSLRVSEGPRAATASLQTSVAEWSLWGVAMAVALAASHRRTLADRRDGFELLADMNGLGSGGQLLARAGAGFWLSLRLMLLPCVTVGLASLAVSSSGRVALDRARVLAAVTGYAVVTSLVLPSLGALVEQLSPRRGRSALIAILLLSAALAELANDPMFSLLGWLGAALRAMLTALGVGRFA